MEKAKYILYNGRFYISNEEKTYAEAVAVGDGKFLCVGTLQECETYKDDVTEMKDMEGRLILPGLIDGHTHPETIAKSRWRVQMPEFETKEELLEFVKDYCDKHPVSEVPYFFGECYPSTMFDEKGPRKEWIDEYVSDRPVRLQDFTDHACWYNSKALELMGITADTPEKGIAPFYQRDENNEPTGWVLEPIPTDGAEEVMFDKIGWHPPTEVTEETIMPFLDFLNDYGVIALMDGITEGEEAMKLFYELDKAGKLNMYYEGTCMLDEFDKLDECIAEIRKWQENYTSDHVRIHTMKFFLDQTNEMGTGASLEPHRNDPTGQNYGELNMGEEELTKVLLRLNREGIDLHIHVVCDRGFRTACNAYERAKEQAAAVNEPWKIYMELAHCELVHPDDMVRPAKLGIIINWSTHWAGGYFGEAAIEYLGKERWNTMYDMTKFIETGAVVTYSSDVIGMNEEHRGNPYFGMEISATRVDLEDPLDPEQYPGSVRQPESAKLSVEEMIRGYTRYGAIPLRLEDKLGTIEKGKMANLVVLDKDILTIPKTDIHTIKPEAVMFDGKFIR
ncbi:N-substituted formamide deformylase precursor [uncultured Eubacterium sp.]|uniref:amidohydrolase n=1 Tax=Brotomerdimonas butyrica TaxID=2981721 RepID=UPI0008208D7F|nr:amidohydrolase family protein [Brotomerdimonas butyrica]MCU6755679.1 amidohydrolase family protein [Brotomerdimonas butyrica]SCH42797.1 N-substituted formamide deformylase precursor [uncultured Eubacterium sp.]